MGGGSDKGRWYQPFLFKLAGNPPVGNSQIYEFNPYSLASRLRVQKGSERSYSVRDPDLDRAFRDAVEKRLPGTFREPEDAWVVVGGIGDGDVPFDGPHDMLELKGPLRELAAKNGEKEQERFRTALLAWYALLDSVRPLDAMAVQGRYYVFIASFPDFR